MINPTQLHRMPAGLDQQGCHDTRAQQGRLPAGLDQQGRYDTRAQAVRLTLTPDEQIKLTQAARWFSFTGRAAGDARNTDGMGFEAADVLRRADVREALDDINFGDDLTNAACWLAAGITAIGVVSFVIGVFL